MRSFLLQILPRIVLCVFFVGCKGVKEPSTKIERCRNVLGAEETRTSQFAGRQQEILFDFFQLLPKLITVGEIGELAPVALSSGGHAEFLIGLEPLAVRQTFGFCGCPMDLLPTEVLMIGNVLAFAFEGEVGLLPTI